MIRPIAISLSPNTELTDVLLALKTMFAPWSWTRGGHVRKVEEWFRRFLKKKYVFSFDSGRSAELAILRSLGIGIGDEVILQAFTCVAVPNSILWMGAKPVYVDIYPETFNIDIRDLEKKITKKTKAIIIQHTFGIAGDLEKIKKITKKHKLFLIEDCAHALGGEYQDRKLGSFGDAAFFSFGRDKVISSVFGGIAITGNKIIADKLGRYEKSLPFPSLFWIAQQLFHPISFAFILPLYNSLGIGRGILLVLQKLKLLSIPVVEKEKIGGKPRFYPRRLPNGLAILAAYQLKKLEKFNKHRVEIAKFYMQNIKGPYVFPRHRPGDIFLRFPLLTINSVKRKVLFDACKKRNILVGNWYSNVVDPVDVDLAKVGYVKGSCPVSEQAAKTIINLPTYPLMNLRDAEKVMEVFSKV